MTENNTSIHLFHSPITGTASRLIKTGNSLLKLKVVEKVIAVGYWDENLPIEEEISPNFLIHRLQPLKHSRTIKKSFYRGLLVLIRFSLFQIMCFKYCLKIKPRYISCHNAQLLLLTSFIKLFINVKIIYEPHELESHKTSLSPIKRKLTYWVEKIGINYCEKIICVCEPITDFYIEKFGLSKKKVVTVRNVPINPSLGKPFQRSNLFREEFNIPKEDIIFLYQGVLDDVRDIDNYIFTFKRLPKNYHIVLMGYGRKEHEIKTIAQNESNIHFKSAVKVEEIIKYSSSADVGLFVISGSISLSYTYALPNKFFEYSIAGLNICISENFKLLSEYVNRYEVGEIIESGKSSLFEWIISKHNRNEFLRLSPKSSEFRQTIGWQNEEIKFHEVY